MQALTNAFKKVTSALTPTKKNNSATPAATAPSAPPSAFAPSIRPVTVPTTATKNAEAFNTSQKGGRRKTRKSKKASRKRRYSRRR